MQTIINRIKDSWNPHHFTKGAKIEYQNFKVPIFLGMSYMLNCFMILVSILSVILSLVGHIEMKLHYPIILCLVAIMCIYFAYKLPYQAETLLSVVFGLGLLASHNYER